MYSLKKNKDFRNVYRNGNSYATRNLVLYKLKSNNDYNRYGFSISKKIGKAVFRNKLKRRLKEIIRDIEKDNIDRGYDLVFIARKPIVKINFRGIERDVRKLCEKMSILDYN